MVEIEYEITSEDYVAAAIAWYSRPVFKRIVIQGIPSALIIYCTVATLFFNSFFGTETAATQFYFRLQIVLYFIGSIWFYWYMQPKHLSKVRRKSRQKTIQRHPEMVGRRKTLLNEAGIHITRTELAEVLEYTWDSIVKSSETPDLFLFYRKHTTQYTFIPKRDLKPQEIEDCRSIIQQHVPI